MPLGYYALRVLRAFFYGGVFMLVKKAKLRRSGYCTNKIRGIDLNPRNEYNQFMLSQPVRRTQLNRQQALFWIFGGLYLSWLIWGEKVPEQQLLLGQLTMIFTTAVGLYFSWKNHHLYTEITYKRSWLWISLGFLSFFVQQFIWFLENILPLPLSLHPLTAILYAIGNIFFWIGLFLYPFKLRTLLGKPRLLLELTLTHAALITIFWLALIKPFAPALQTLGVFQFLPLIFDLTSIIILISMFILSETRQKYTHLSWMAFGFIAFLFSDMGYLSLLSSQQHYSAGSAVDLGWVIGDLILIMVLLRQTTAVQPHQQSFWGRIFIRIQSLLPTVTVIVLGWYSIITWQFSGILDNLGLWTTLVLGLGLFLRQGIIAGEFALEQYASLVNSIAEPAFICDQNGSLRTVNPALLEIGNFENQDILFQPLESLFDFSPEEQTWWDAILQKKQKLVFKDLQRELTLKTKYGHVIPVMLSLRPIQNSSNPSFAIAGTAHDLRLQKMQQNEIRSAYEEVAQARAALERLNAGLEQLVNEKTADLQTAYAQLEEQNKQLQQLDQIKSDFVSLVSHELRAPLTNIRGGIELLLSGYIQEPERINQFLQQVQMEILRLSQFTETILDLSALDANRLPLYPEPMPLSKAVINLQNYYQNSPEYERMLWDIPETLPPIMADHKALHSILFHILDNAVKYAPQGTITLSAQPQQDFVNITITDQGKGIPEEALPLLFERFYRASMDDAQTVYGHGLGLYLVRRFTEAMQGEVHVQNTPQGGAQFTIRLPSVT